MKGIFTTVRILVIAILAFVVVARCARAEDQKSLEAELRHAYEQRLLSLRNPYFGKTLSFDPSGVPTDQVVAGPWSTCGLLQVQKIRITEEGIEIDGKRAILAFRLESGKSKSVKLQINPILTREVVRIRIKTSTVNVKQVNDSLGHVFQGGRLLDRFAAYWKPMTNDLKAFRLRTPNGIIGELEGGRPAYLVNRGVVEEPKPIYNPNPEYTEAAHDKRLQGTIGLSIVVNEQGLPEILEITRGLGEGLDIQALATVELAL